MLKRFLEDASAQVAVAAQKMSRRMGQPSGVAVLAPPSPHKNRGDEALLRSLMAGLLARKQSVSLFATGKDGLTFLADEDYGSCDRHHDSYPAFTSLQSMQNTLQLLSRLNRFAEVILVGADVVDEGYGLSRSHSTLRVLELCVQVGIPSRIVSFSINELPSLALRGRFSEIARHARLFVRDPRSIQRLSSAEIANITPSGDLAYLLEPAPIGDVPGWLTQYLAEAAGPVIGINVIRKVLGSGDEFQRRMDVLALACCRLAEEDRCRFVLIPHDDYEDSCDLEEFSKRLNGLGGAEWTRLVDPVPRAALAKRIAGLCTHVFTCRLHLGIATMGMGRPMTGFPYQGKFEGQFDLFGLSHEGLISPERFPTTVDDMVGMMRRRIAQSEELAGQIQSRLPAVRALSLKNFEGLGTPVEQEPA